MIGQPSNLVLALQQRTYPDPIGPDYLRVPPGRLPEHWPMMGGDRWYEAIQNWSKSSTGHLYGMCRVKCNPIVDGEPDTETEVCVYLWTPYDASNRVMEGHPNVVDGQRILAATMADGLLYAKPPYLFGTIGRDVLPWHGPISEIPAGWQFCDGSNDPKGNPVPDYRGRSMFFYYGENGLPAADNRGAEGDYDTIGQIIDRYKLTLTHDQHRHAFVSCTNAGTGATLAVNYEDTYTDYTVVPPHTDVDIRPARIVTGVRIRVANWVGW